MKELKNSEIEVVSGGAAWFDEFTAVYDAATDFISGFQEGYQGSTAHKI